ncbi:hypothetical protein AGMMS5026_06920 [Endomicrobiia bacterium]|nr:hypothetical protein AGMMS49523_03000 [Endomicrobiia bacterium]GHT12102.1 hypothetical protein AGMMS49571_03510 [Endomicrobiia bacterium]GHT21009.1 hypothetical protein AGMMS49929_08940 [Endomicrobiia bacterium]GHT26065.1 hypothetical protein AGMMS49995_01810 [Endomicrobiia bacterium]GHT31102.1 hypothetical protein AGMMS5026_06920 [Endomicrobiia bacterium]
MRSIHDYYAELVFTKKVMEQKLSKNIYKKLTAAIENLESLDQSIAGEVCARNERMGARKRCNAFYTLVSASKSVGTAQKHDSFIDYRAPTEK